MNDRNSFIGMLLIGAILIGWMIYNQPSKEQIAAQKRVQDSIARVEQNKKAIEAQAAQLKMAKDTASVAIVPDSLANAKQLEQFRDFTPSATGTNTAFVLENEKLKVLVNSHGGAIAGVFVKNYKTWDGKPVNLIDSSANTFGFAFKGYNGTKSFETNQLYFTPVDGGIKKVSADSSVLTLRATTSQSNKYIEYVYGIGKNTYKVSYKVNWVGLDNIVTATSPLTLNWHTKTPSLEKSAENQANASGLYYKPTDDTPDFLSMRKRDSAKAETDLSWISFKQQFFTSVLIPEKAFPKEKTYMASASLTGTHHIKELTAKVDYNFNGSVFDSHQFAFYFGPNHYKTLKTYGHDLERQIPLGWGIFGWVNRFLVIPVFNFLSSLNMGYGAIILILTILVKLILFPIAYKTYMSSAKMRVLKPEIDEINQKFPNADDAMRKQQAVMSLYQKAGVNPLAGCVPLLLQLPILIALFNFFPSSIELRQQSFLWAKDLSTYDSVLDLGFNIPFYGDHVSLFTILMTISTLLYTHMNSQMMTGSNDQMAQMKWVMYLMPIMFLGIFNNYSAGLSYYYFLANMFTFAQQKVIQRFVDEDEIHRKIQENKQKPKKQSSFAKRLEEMAKQQQALKNAQNQKGKK